MKINVIQLDINLNEKENINKIETLESLPDQSKT